jgi:hypothetical protein
MDFAAAACHDRPELRQRQAADSRLENPGWRTWFMRRRSWRMWAGKRVRLGSGLAAPGRGTCGPHPRKKDDNRTIMGFF